SLRLGLPSLRLLGLIPLLLGPTPHLILSLRLIQTPTFLVDGRGDHGGMLGGDKSVLVPGPGPVVRHRETVALHQDDLAAVIQLSDQPAAVWASDAVAAVWTPRILAEAAGRDHAHGVGAFGGAGRLVVAC